MSADLLRRAAAKLRERAEAATGSPWSSDAGRVRSPHAAPGMPVVRDKEPALAICRKVEDADFIALMHPQAVLLLADLLDDEAEIYDDLHSSNALAVARAVLREDGES